MLEGLIWGLIQGITEFLPVSSDGHLVLIPKLLGVAPPDLAITGFLHLGTLLAVVVYFRKELLRIITATQRSLFYALVAGTLPAAAAFFFEDLVAQQQASTTATAIYLLINAVVLMLGHRYGSGKRSLETIRPVDGLAVGVAQVFAILPGLSRSGTTITTALARNFTSTDAARFSFMLAVPVVAGAGVYETAQLATRGIPGSAWLGAAVAAFAGYAAIGLLLRVIVRIGLLPFAIYCAALGVMSLIVLD